MYEFKLPNKRRPVLVLARQDAIEVLPSILVAPISTTVRGLPSEVVLDESVGLKSVSAVMLDGVQCVEQARLRHFVGSLTAAQLRQVCAALEVAVGCDDAL
jgi:mRNA interferase MazF